MKNFYFETEIEKLDKFKNKLYLMLQKEVNKNLSLYVVDPNDNRGLVLSENQGIKFIFNNEFEKGFIDFEINSREKNKKENPFGIIVFSKKTKSDILVYLQQKCSKLNKYNMFYCWVIVK